MLRKPRDHPVPGGETDPFPRYRARIVLTRDPDGDERCVACYLCSAACPVDCISMQATEAKTAAAMPAWFRINFSRCIYCGLCDEACPTLAIQMTPRLRVLRPRLLELVEEKEDLLIDDGGKDNEYDFYKHAGIGVANPRGGNEDEYGPVDIRSNLP